MNIFLRILMATLSVLPSIPTIIQHVELATNGKSTGAQKKAAVDGLVQDAVTATANIAPGTATTAAVAGAGVAAIVQGVFDTMKAAGALHEVSGQKDPAPAVQVPGKLLDFRAADADLPVPYFPAAAVSQPDGHAEGEAASHPAAHENASANASAPVVGVNANGDPIKGHASGSA